MDLDHALHSIGDHGRGQILIFTIVCSIAQLPASWHIFGILFLGATPEHLCKGPGDSHPQYTPVFNISVVAVCEEETPCEEGWIYSEETYGSTIVTEWDLVCDRASLVDLSQTIMMVGVMVGSLVAGYLADRFGRKNVLFIGLFVQGLVGVALAFSPTITVFILIRFVMGFLDQMYELPAYSMISELFTPRCRPYAFICMLNFWAAGIFTLPGLAYFIRDWRYLQFAMSLPFLFAPLFYWVIPESPRWLLSVGRYEEASKIVNRIAQINGKGSSNFVLSDRTVSQKLPEGASENENGSGDLPQGEEIIIVQPNAPKREQDTIDRGCKRATSLGGESPANVQAGQSNSYLQLFRSYLIAKVSLIMGVLWFVSAFSYYGLSLNAGRLVGDPYLNVFLSGMVEIPSHLVATLCVVWVGRRWPICFTLLTTCVACVAVVLIPSTTESGEDLTGAIVATATVGKFSVAISYAISCLYATEVFPTTLRNKGIAFVAITARVGALIAPFVLVLGERHPNAPMLLFGAAVVIPGMLVLLLPEMKGRPQPQTIADLKAFFREDRQRRKSTKSDSTQRQEVTSQNNQEMKSQTNRAFELGGNG